MLFSVMKKKLYLKKVIPTLHRAITLTKHLQNYKMFRRSRLNINTLRNVRTYSHNIYMGYHRWVFKWICWFSAEIRLLGRYRNDGVMMMVRQYSSLYHERTTDDLKRCLEKKKLIRFFCSLPLLIYISKRQRSIDTGTALRHQLIP